jgi:hypothetical protein
VGIDADSGEVPRRKGFGQYNNNNNNNNNNNVSSTTF